MPLPIHWFFTSDINTGEQTFRRRGEIIEVKGSADLIGCESINGRVLLDTMGYAFPSTFVQPATTLILQRQCYLLRERRMDLKGPCLKLRRISGEPNDKDVDFDALLRDIGLTRDIFVSSVRDIEEGRCYPTDRRETILCFTSKSEWRLIEPSMTPSSRE